MNAITPRRVHPFYRGIANWPAMAKAIPGYAWRITALDEDQEAIGTMVHACHGPAMVEYLDLTVEWLTHARADAEIDVRRMIEPLIEASCPAPAVAKLAALASHGMLTPGELRELIDFAPGPVRCSRG